MSKAKLIEAAALGITKDLTDQGKLIEAGFAAFRHFVMAKDAPADQVREMRLAWMGGAEHLFSSIMAIMDPGEEPTVADLKRMDLIDKEISTWRGTLSQRVDPAQGSA